MIASETEIKRIQPGAVFICAIFILIVILVSGSVGAAEEPVVAPPVRSIEIRGLNRIDEATVRPRIMHAVGDLLSMDDIAKDIKSIFDTGYFKDVSTQIESFEGGVKVIFIVVEKPAIRAVEFYGNENMDEAKLREKLGVSPGAIADPVLISDGASTIRNMYETEGYPLAVVVPVLRSIGDDRVSVVYHISEGPRVKIGEIVYEGNEHVKKADLDKAIRSSEWWFWRYVVGGGRYERTSVEYDIEAIKNVYLDRGYLKVDVAVPVIEYSPDKLWVNMKYKVTEGQQYKLSSIGFSGNEKYSDEELRARLKSKPGEVLSKKLISADIETITLAYSDKGYAMVSVYPELNVDDSGLTSSITFRIRENGIFSIGRIDIRGNVNTRDKVIRREVRQIEGDTYNGTLLKRSYQRLLNLNYFEEVKFTPKPDPATSKVDLDIDVKEKSTGSFSLGAGYSTVDKFVGVFELTEGNLFGRGQVLKLKAEVGTTKNTYDISFTEPWLFDKPTSFTASIYKTENEYDDYDKGAYGLYMGVGRSFGEFWRAGVGYRIERLNMHNISDSASSYLLSQEGESTTSSISPYVIRDTRDSTIDPHSGMRHKLSFTYAGIGGDNYYGQAEIDSMVFFPLPFGMTIALSGDVAMSTGLFGHEVPLSSRYQVGGIYTLRGLRDVGVSDSEGTYIGGEKKMLFSVEYIFPISEEAKFKGVLFSDVGTAYDVDPDFRYSAGVGVRWISPLGPLRLEWAFNLDPREDEPSDRWEFAIGAFF